MNVYSDHVELDFTGSDRLEAEYEQNQLRRAEVIRSDLSMAYARCRTFEAERVIEQVAGFADIICDKYIKDRKDYAALGKFVATLIEEAVEDVA